MKFFISFLNSSSKTRLLNDKKMIGLVDLS